MKNFLQWLPKTTISAILSATLVYCLGKGYIWTDEANYLSALWVALWLSINLITKK